MSFVAWTLRGVYLCIAGYLSVPSSYLDDAEALD
jgi:hypothetical protein